MAKAKKEPEQEIYGSVIRIKISEIIPDPNQPRKEFNEADLHELAESIKNIGVLQPIAVHKAPEDIKFHLIYGERRLRASEMAGIADIPCILFDKLDDNTVLEMQIIENMQRKNINPMEESDAFQQLISRGLITAEQIADRLGTSTKYIYDRLTLQRVIPEVQQAVKEGRLTVTHGKQFARMNEDDQKKVWEEVHDDDTLTVADIRREISSIFQLELSKAPFNTTDTKLVKKAGSCLKCTKRSGCRPLLFEDIEERDVCFDAVCWEAKVNAHIEAVIDAEKAKGNEVKLISERWNTKKEGVLSKNEFGISEEETGIVGVYVEVNEYSGTQPGHLVNLEKEEEEQQQDNDYIDGFVGKKSDNTEYVDHGEKFSRVVFDTLIEKFNESYQSINNDNIHLCFLQDQFSRLEDQNIRYICEKMGWKIIEDSDDDIDIEATIRAAADSMETGRNYLLPLLFLINKAEQYWDRSDVEYQKKYFDTIDIDLSKLMDEYEASTGHKF